MSAGAYNQRITIQQKTVTRDSYNENVEAWSTLLTVWAEIITTGGREYYAAQKLNAETSAVFKVRYLSTITPQMRIVYNSKTFEILSVNDVNARHAELHISAKEVA